VDGGVIDRRKKSGLEARNRELFGVPTDGDTVGRVIEDTPHGVSKHRTVGLPDQRPGFTVHDRFQGASFAERDDRCAAGLRLDRNDAEIFGSGQQNDVGGLIQGSDLLIGPPAEKFHIWTGKLAKTRFFGPLPYNPEGDAGKPAGFDGEI
jgi:hypothetical protein